MEVFNKVFDEVCIKKNIPLNIITSIQQCSSSNKLCEILKGLDKKTRNYIYLALIWQHKNNNGKKEKYKYMEDVYKKLINSELGKKAYFIGNFKFYLKIFIISIPLLMVMIIRLLYDHNYL